MSAPEPAGETRAGAVGTSERGTGEFGTGTPGTGELGTGAAGTGEITATLAGLARPELIPEQRRGLLGRLSAEPLLRSYAERLPRPRAWRPSGAAQWVAGAVGDLAPHVPVRDLATLEHHYPGLDPAALAQRLIRNAALATAGVGAASGGLAAVKWTVPPTLLSAPVLLGVETVAVVAIELKLVGELHQAYRVAVPGTGVRKAIALLQSWAHQRGVDRLLPNAGIGVALGTAARQELTDRLARRFGSNLPTLAPLLVGAAAASFLNRRATRALGHRLCTDLARRPEPATLIKS